jgi:uncharacterized membrane protein YeaQ/YmgE (transglycosylase-associated protein family)
MNFFLWIAVGALIGWLASIVLRSDAHQGLFVNVVVGLIGALIGGWLIAPLVGADTIHDGAFNVPSFVVSLIGAIVLVTVVRLLRRRRSR